MVSSFDQRIVILKFASPAISWYLTLAKRKMSSVDPTDGREGLRYINFDLEKAIQTRESTPEAPPPRTTLWTHAVRTYESVRDWWNGDADNEEAGGMRASDTENGDGEEQRQKLASIQKQGRWYVVPRQLLQQALHDSLAFRFR